MPTTPMRIQVSAPCRADFAGPWTDTSNYYEISPFGYGQTLNAAIVLQNNRGEDQYVCATIDRQRGIRKNIDQPHDVGGLGTSASLNVVEAALVVGKNLYNCLTDEGRIEVARMAYRVANVGYGLKGGWQDELAACIGGFTVYTLHADGRIEFERLSLKDETIASLQRRMILYDTGASRLSSDIHYHVWGNLDRSIPLMDRMVELVEPTRQALLEGNLDAFGCLLNETCDQLFHLHDSVGDFRIRNAFNVLKEEDIFLGGKPCGAGGGGACMMLVREGSEKRAKELLTALPEGEVLNWRFDLEGLRIGPVVLPTFLR